MKTEHNILVAFILNVIFSIFELVGGILTGSIAILSDSLHDLGDALSIGISYFLEKKSKKKSDENYTYGYIRYSVLGSIFTSTILFVGSTFVIIEAIKRLFNPTTINYNGMIVFAIFGVIVNFIAAYTTREGDSLNQKAVNLHMLEDVLGWTVVLLGSILMRFTNIVYIDSVLSILVALFILVNAFGNLKIVFDLFLEKIPVNINISEVKNQLLKIDGVCGVHHVHVRSIDGFNNYATLHVVVKEYSHDIKGKIKEELKHNNINHSTIELELENEDCHDEKCSMNTKKTHHH